MTRAAPDPRLTPQTVRVARIIAAAHGDEERRWRDYIETAVAIVAAIKGGEQ